MRLTKLQRQIIADYDALAAPSKIDIMLLPSHAEDRTLLLRLVFHEWVRAKVIMKYALIDEYLACIIANYYFGRPKEPHYGKLWRTKKFQRFNYQVLDEMYLPKKKDLVHAIRPLSSTITSKIMKINDVRNALAHSFFPQNRRRYRKPGRKPAYCGVTYDGIDIFTRPGYEKFYSDADDVLELLHSRALPPFGPGW
jgi:hypothetical protein